MSKFIQRKCYYLNDHALTEYILTAAWYHRTPTKVLSEGHVQMQPSLLDKSCFLYITSHPNWWGTERDSIATRCLPVQARKVCCHVLKFLAPTTWHSAAGMLAVPLRDARGNLSLSFLLTLVFSHRGQNKTSPAFILPCSQMCKKTVKTYWH